MVAIDPQATRNDFEINDIRSIYPKRDSSVANWVGDGLLICVKKSKGREWLENSAGSNSRQLQARAASDNPMLYDASAVRNASKCVDENGEPPNPHHIDRYLLLPAE